MRCSLLLALALALPYGPLDPPALCVGAPAIPGADAELTFYDAPLPAGWVAWSSAPARIAQSVDGQAVAVEIGPQRPATLPTGLTYINAFPLVAGARFWLYACAPGEVPPGAGWRVALPMVTHGDV